MFCIIAFAQFSRRWGKNARLFFPPASAVEGIKSVPCVCVCVCLSVSWRSHGRTVWCTDAKFSVMVDLDNVSDEFEGQGHRSKFKVATLKKRYFQTFLWCYVCRSSLSWHLTPCDVTARRHVTSRYNVMTSHDVMVWRHDVKAWHPDILWRLLGKNTDKKGTSREGASTLRRFHFVLYPLTQRRLWICHRQV